MKLEKDIDAYWKTTSFYLICILPPSYLGVSFFIRNKLRMKGLSVGVNTRNK